MDVGADSSYTPQLSWQWEPENSLIIFAMSFIRYGKSNGCQLSYFFND